MTFNGFKTIEVEELIEFRTRAGHHIVAKQIKDCGDCLLLEIRQGPRFVGKTLLFPKNNMGPL